MLFCSLEFRTSSLSDIVRVPLSLCRGSVVENVAADASYLELQVAPFSCTFFTNIDL
jgi:hypothetical protein